MDSISELDLSAMPKLANLSGVLIQASIIYNYKQLIK